MREERKKEVTTIYSPYKTKIGMEIHLWDAKVATAHDHDFYEFALCIKGEAKEWRNGEIRVLKKGQATLTTPNDRHALTSKGKEIAQHINLGIATMNFYELAQSFGLGKEEIENFENCIKLNDDEFDYIVNLSNRIFSLDMERDETLYKNSLKQMAFTFFHSFLSRNEPVSVIPQWLKDFVSKVCSPEYYGYKVKDLYALSNYSQTSLSAYFKKYYHTSFVKYFTESKMIYACNLLKNTNFLVLDISTRLGFSSLSHFNHIFKDMMGVSPTEYRNSARNGR